MGMQLIETIEVGSGGASSIEFTSIPQDGVDLVILISARANGIEPNYRLNSDTGTNYSRVTLDGSGSAASTYSSGATTSGGFYASNWASSTSNTFSNIEFRIANYTSSVAKSISSNGVTENNATAAYSQILAASYAGTSPITSISIINVTFVQYSTASLYKITAD